MSIKCHLVIKHRVCDRESLALSCFYLCAIHSAQNTDHVFIWHSLCCLSPVSAHTPKTQCVSLCHLCVPFLTGQNSLSQSSRCTSTKKIVFFFFRLVPLWSLLYGTVSGGGFSCLHHKCCLIQGGKDLHNHFKFCTFIARNECNLSTYQYCVYSFISH